MAGNVLAAMEKYLASDQAVAEGKPEAAQTAKAELQRAVESHGSAARPYGRVLVAVDRTGHPALQAGVKLARALGATLGVVYVVDVTPLAAYAGPFTTRETTLRLLRESGQKVVEAIGAELPDDVKAECVLREGLPTDEILSAAKVFGADVVVTGTHRRGPMAQFFLGSTSEGLIRNGSFPVMLAADVPCGPEAARG